MAWPVTGSLLLTNVVDLVDIAMVSRLGRESVAAVGYAAQYGHLVRSMLLAVGVACVALVARAIGARERAAAGRSLAGSLIVGVSAAFGFALFAVLLPKRLILLLDAEASVASRAAPYFRLLLCSMLLYAVSVVLESAQRAHRNTRTPLLIAAVAAALKILLNTLLIFGLFGLPRLELVGAGIASVCAETLSVLLYVGAARYGTSEGQVLLPSLSDLRSAASASRDVLRVSLPAVGERLVMSIALLVYFAILSHYGTSVIAAYSIGVRLLAFSWLPALGFGAAAATLVGQALGATEVEYAKRVGWRSMWLALYVMAGLGAACIVLRQPLARVFTHDAGVIEQLLPFLMMLAVAQPFMGVHFTLSGALRGSGDTLTPLIGATVGNWALRMPLAWVCARLLGLPVIWVWGALVADHMLRCAWYVLSFKRGRWARESARAVVPS